MSSCMSVYSLHLYPVFYLVLLIFVSKISQQSISVSPLPWFSPLFPNLNCNSSHWFCCIHLGAYWLILHSVARVMFQDRSLRILFLKHSVGFLLLLESMGRIETKIPNLICETQKTKSLFTSPVLPLACFSLSHPLSQFSGRFLTSGAHQMFLNTLDHHPVCCQ